MPETPRPFLARLHTGTKICLLLSVVLLVGALYYYLAPVLMPTAGGWFGCGSAANPPTDPFPKGSCGAGPHANLLKSMCLLALAVIVAGLGWLFFGADKASAAGRDERAEDDRFDDDFDGYHEPSRAAGSSSRFARASRDAVPASPVAADETDDAAEDDFDFGGGFVTRR